MDKDRIIKLYKKIKRYSKPILRAIRNANNIKLLLLTATPIDQDPFEIAILINLLKKNNATENQIKNAKVFFKEKEITNKDVQDFLNLN